MKRERDKYTQGDLNLRCNGDLISYYWGISSMSKRMIDFLDFSRVAELLQFQYNIFA